MKPFLILIIIALIVCCVGRKYHKHSLLRCTPEKEEDLRLYNEILRTYDIKLWRQSNAVNKPIEFSIKPEDKDALLKSVESWGLLCQTIIKDIQVAFDNQTVKEYVRRDMASFDWRSYFRMKDIHDWLHDLSSTHPDKIRVQSIGKTYQNNDIMAVKLKLNKTKVRSKVIIEGGIHAREWISTAFVTYLLHQLLHASTSNDEALKEIAETYEWHFIPLLNPDGYEYSHTQDRLWRKNRNGDYGVDLNRNFDSKFGFSGISYIKYDEIYCGKKPFSEEETKALTNYIRTISEDIEYYLSFHAYGQYVIIPYAYSKNYFDNYWEVKNMTREVENKIAQRYKTKYTSGTAYDTVGYTTSGVSCDWAKKTFQIPYAVTFELRDNGYFGFALPPSEILPTCQETLDGIVSLLKPKTEEFKVTKMRMKRLRHYQNHCTRLFNDLFLLFSILLLNLVRFI